MTCLACELTFGLRSESVASSEQKAYLSWAHVMIQMMLNVLTKYLFDEGEQVVSLNENRCLIK